MAEDKTGIYILAGLAAVGIAAYFIFKKKCPEGMKWDDAQNKCIPITPPPGGVSADISGLKVYT